MNKISPFATTWMDLEDIMLSEINQTQKNKYYVILVICGIQIDSSKQRVEWWSPGAGRGWEKWEMLAQGIRLKLCKMSQF